MHHRLRPKSESIPFGTWELIAGRFWAMGRVDGENADQQANLG